ncbi:hypothetical protein K2O51_01445 [Cupriavidus pinatubonensis]|uniref:hypothetical protein n=1 Tax=Cupriavidus pinatubonensis TaxID=248026 RepID=UPI00112BED87|nr:hypothetical protein [Cupriavidus pinatubonensis]QYY28917.1 hypothetical protein K2O51_01445 [Cupriavidus pinatubonensis]TPQ38597.1 hypothetical protein C2U69_13815 [Cupriavidus pinatubonensis]
MKTKAQHYLRNAPVAALALLASGVAWGEEPAESRQGTAAPAASRAMPAGAVICDAPWFRSGSQVQMEGDGALPMSITMTLRNVGRSPSGCRAQLEVMSKSAMSALMGPPVVMDQVHMVNIDRRTPAEETSIESQHAIINARARYARMYGEAAFKGKGVFNYAGLNLREGSTLDGETFESSLSLKIYPLGSDQVVGTMRALHASINISSRQVGRRQMIDTVLGRRECLPITYEKRTSLGPLLVGEEVVQVEPSVMQITDWYCPAEAFVLRTEVKQDGKVQRIDVTAMELDTKAP